MSLPEPVIVVGAGAVFVLVLAVVVTRRPTNSRLAALRGHPAGRLAPEGTLLREMGIPAVGDGAAHLSRAWCTDEDPEALAARFTQDLGELGFVPTDESLRPGDVTPSDRLLLHMRAGAVRYALVLQPLPALVGDYVVTHGCRNVVRAIMEG